MDAEYYRRQLDALVNNATLALFIMDEHQHCTFMNAAAEQLTGYTLPEVQGRPLHEVVHHTRPDGTPYPLEECPIDRAFPKDMQEQGEEVFVHKDGSFYPVAFTASPIREGDRTVGTIIEVRGIAEEKAREAERQRAVEALREQTKTLETIIGVNATLVAELDLQKLVQSVTDAGRELTGARFGAFFYNVVNQEGESFMLYTISGVPRERFSRFPMPRNTPIFHATFSGAGIVRAEDITKDPRYGRMPPYYGMPEGHLPVRSYLAVPVISRTGEVIGGLFFGHEAPGVFTDRCEAIVAGIADQAAIAIENARLFETTQVEIAERKHAEEQLRLLADANALLGSSLDHEQTLRHIGELIVPRLADWYAVDLLGNDGQPHRVALAHVDPNKVALGWELHRRYPMDLNAGSGVGAVIRTGEPEFYPEITDEVIAEAAGQDEELHRIIRTLGLRSALTVPLTLGGRILGALTLVRSEANRRYTHTDLRFAQELAGRAAAAIENTRLYREARMAEAHLRALNEELEERVHARTQELEIRNQELQDFAYIASHDLQEPLRKIHSFVEVLQIDYKDALGENAWTYLDRIQSAVRRMTTLIQDLLHYSRVSTHGQELAATDLNRIIGDVLSDLEVRIQDAGGEVLVEPLPTIEADPTQMRQLFQNLIGNALKFHQPSIPPIVRVSARPAATQGAPPNNPSYMIEVTDNGIGFDPRHTDHIFQPFKRLHTRSEYEGSGVGLAIVKRIVERHGGSIHVHSTPGAGTTFSITLPSRQQVARGAASRTTSLLSRKDA